MTSIHVIKAHLIKLENKNVLSVVSDKFSNLYLNIMIVFYMCPPTLILEILFLLTSLI